MMARLGQDRGVLSVVVLVCVLVLLESTVSAIAASSLSRDDDEEEGEQLGTNMSGRFTIISFNFHRIGVPYLVCLWILIANVGFHLYDKLPQVLPESCLLIVLGILAGAALYLTETSPQYNLDANILFLFLLPPIIYESGYHHMPNKACLNNKSAILLLAVVNALWNTFGIGVGIWSMSSLGWINQKISICSCLIFSALISAVDPVAVLTKFEKFQANEILYILVFGESLLNNDLTMVLCHLTEGFTSVGESNIVDFLTGFVRFFIVVIGGILVGAAYSFMGALITKYMDHVRVIEPIFIFVLGYLAYQTAEILGLSSILSLIFGSIIMRHYTEAFPTKNSTMAGKYFMKMLATISATIIFTFLGLSTAIDPHDFHLDFIVVSILFSLIFRVSGLVLLSFIVSRHRLVQLSAIDQFVTSYEGLQGAVAFCLTLLLNKQHIPEKAMFVTTTTVIVFLTVLIQGITIKPIVNALKVEKTEVKDPSMNETIHKRIIDHLMAGVEDIVGKTGHSSFQHKFHYYNTKYLQPLLLREKPKGRNPSIVQTFTKLNMPDTKATVLFPHVISRHHSFSQLISCSPTTANLFSRRATIAVAGTRNLETVINICSTNTLPTKIAGKDLAMRHLLGSSLIEPTSKWVRECGHTLPEVNKQPVFYHSDCKHLNQLLTQSYLCSKLECSNYGIAGDKSNTTANSSDGTDNRYSTAATSNGFENSQKVNAFMNHHQVIGVVSDAVSVKESTDKLLDSAASQLVFHQSLAGPSIESQEPQLASSVENYIESLQTNLETSCLTKTHPQSSPCLDTNSSRLTRKSTDTDKVESKGFHDLPQTIPDNIPSYLSKHQVSWSYGEDDDDVFVEDQKSTSQTEINTIESGGTLAETTLPWRRQTSLPPVPSSLSLSLPDDENPLMSEAPSWADNLAYNHLTESGSPYQSPQTTITAKPTVTPPRPVFDIFPQNSLQHSDCVVSSISPPCDKEVSSIPPPWSFKERITDNFDEDPIPSRSATSHNSGDKASCFLVSSHDLVPPSYHSCRQITPRGPELSITRRHSEVSSPSHFQYMEKLEFMSAASLECQLIGIEEDYHHSMKERVSQWLTNPDNLHEQFEDNDNFLTSKEEGDKILESLRQKKLDWSLGDDGEGTDADDESENDIDDIRL